MKLGEITSEHSEKSQEFNLEDYLKFREQAPDYPDEEEEEEPKQKQKGKKGKKQEEEEEDDDDDEDDVYFFIQ